MKILISLFVFALANNASAAQVHLQCKNWEGKVLVDVRINAPAFSQRVKWKDFLNQQEELLHVTRARVKNTLTNDTATERHQPSWSFLRDSDGTIVAQLNFLQESPTEDDDLDTGKGVTVDLPNLISAYEIVADTTEKFAAINTALLIGDLRGFDHGEDNTDFQEVVCKASVTKP